MSREWNFWTVAIGGGIAGGILGALAESWFAHWLEGLRERRRERKKPIDPALNWEQGDRSDSLRHAYLRKADLRGTQQGKDASGDRGGDLSYADLTGAHLDGANLSEVNLCIASDDDESTVNVTLGGGSGWCIQLPLVVNNG